MNIVKKRQKHGSGWFGFKTRGSGPWTVSLTPYIEGNILFQDIGSKTTLFTYDLEFLSSQTAATVHTLEQFYEEVAGEIDRIVKDFLKKEKK